MLARALLAARLSDASGPPASLVWGGLRAAPGAAPGARRAVLAPQVIYPLSVSEATAALLGDSPADRVAALDARLDALAAVVRLGYLIEREGGWGAVAEWGESLSLGARRRSGAAGLGAARPEGSYLTAGATGAQSFRGPRCWSLSLAARAAAKAASSLHGFMMAI